MASEVANSYYIFIFVLTFGCKRVNASLSPLDPYSFSLPDLAKIKHATLSLDVDFSEKILSGSVVLDFEVKKNIKEVVLDVSDLDIESIALTRGTVLKYEVGKNVPNFGSKLTITLPETYGPKKELKIKIVYKTAPTASALQWLEPKQTSGKKLPYLYSQCEAIQARSIMPCQDSPAIKFTYDATITAPPEFTVLMSALRKEPSNGKTYFTQPVPIPSYLMALAVGSLESKRVGPRTVVWTEKEQIERAAWEFADTEKYLQAAERLCGPYVWTQYDVLVLPPSFPYGGMENPGLTFYTPLLLIGDRSQAKSIVHEIMHSWTGNLVTTRNFEHIWLNEGFAVFLERKVSASLIANETVAKMSRDFHSIMGLKELRNSMSGLDQSSALARQISVLDQSSALTQLVLDLDGIPFDDALSKVPYEKGSLFLRYLEDLAGGPEVFDPFIRSYLDHFKEKSLDTDLFKNFFLGYFKDNENLKEVNWDKWLYATGMPPIIPDYDTSMTKAIEDIIPKFYQDDIPQEVIEAATKFTPHQIYHFLQELLDGEALSVPALHKIEEGLKLSSTNNPEIGYRSIRLFLKAKDRSKVQDAFDFVNSRGSLLHIRPIYRDLYDWEEVRQETIDNFLKNEQYMMHVVAYTLKNDLHLKQDKSDKTVR